MLSSYYSKSRFFSWRFEEAGIRLSSASACNRISYQGQAVCLGLRGYRPSCRKQVNRYRTRDVHSLFDIIDNVSSILLVRLYLLTVK